MFQQDRFDVGMPLENGNEIDSAVTAESDNADRSSRLKRCLRHLEFLSVLQKDVVFPQMSTELEDDPL